MAAPSAAMRRKLQRKFRLRGFTLKVDALEEAAAFLDRFPDAEDDALDLLLDELDKEPLKSSILDRDAVRRVVSLLVEAEEAVDAASPAATSARSALRVVDSFVVPRFHYDPIKKVFYEHTGRLSIHGEAGDKAALYRDRYQVLLQRLARDKYFSRPAFETVMTENDSCEITSIQSLIGCTGRRWIMGVISQLEERQFYLEDLTGAVPIDLANAKITSGFFVENTVIVAEGELLSNGIFQVNTCGFPPLEDREASLSLLMGLDFFGGGVIPTEETLRLSSLENKAVNDMFVILSDVWLDNPETMEKLGIVLDGYESVEVVPSLFVLMGNFCSQPCNLAFNSFEELRLQFGKLGEMIAARTRLKEHSRFLFVPGPDDAGPSKALPRCALPKYLIEELQKHIPNAIFVSNPCRVKFYTQEIVFFRQDLLYRMRRSCLIPPTMEETSDPFEHLVATITHQSHLCPLPLTVQPIIWNYDHCLRLYPTPHTIVLGDKSEQKAFKYTGITCFNPGSFANDSTFAAYRPCTKEVELSALES
ncbi:DNA polymerase epsilon subunit B-like [Lolium rigidum]|uniref:DNA polymerase epsilon subunit B-like n=1 Tax=Lolium rigidum TaxID=89674 RepID=UPI001F5D69FA|nr:DNA polymerase epsilon subunit B-like [Lolium rigidum]